MSSPRRRVVPHTGAEPAIRKVLERSGVSLDDVQASELNQACPITATGGVLGQGIALLPVRG